MTKKGILFDMDGTLINTYENINFRQALSELKTVQKTLILKILKSRVRSFAEMETRILQEVEDPAEGKELVRRVSDFLLEHYDNAPLKKDALMFLQYVKQKNYKICPSLPNRGSFSRKMISSLSAASPSARTAI